MSHNVISQENIKLHHFQILRTTIETNYLKVCAIMTTKKQFTSFDEMLSASELPVLVDFYAEWCGPCHMMSPILEQVNLQLKNRLRIVKIDTEKYPQIANQYDIAALPSLILFKGGQPVDKIEGVVQTSDLVQHLKNFI